jgi:hypothetical protein
VKVSTYDVGKNTVILTSKYECENANLFGFLKIRYDDNIVTLL